MARPRYETPSTTVEPLGKPLKFEFSGKTAKNRFEKAAMSERMATWDLHDPSARGIPSDELITLYTKWGRDGDIGVICTGTISIDPGYMEAPGNLIIHPGDGHEGHRFEQYGRLAAGIKCNGSLAMGQLNHHGRQTQAAHQPDPISASDIKLEQNELKMAYNKPHAASEAEIQSVVDYFTHGAQYLEAAGFDGAQLNAAHGYLFSQFLSPAYNKRTDRWGGSLENRARLLLEVVLSVRQNTKPDFLVSVKLNCVEFEADGFKMDEVKQVAQMLEQARVDVIELSGGTYVEWAWKHFRESTPAREGYFIEEAEQIKPLLKSTKLYATGGWRSAGAMVNASSALDGFGLGRPLAQDPTLCKDILNDGVAGATKQDLNQQIYALSAVLAGSQMLTLSEGGEPSDGSNPETSAAVMKRIEAYMKERRSGGWGEQYGHLRIIGAAPNGHT